MSLWRCGLVAGAAAAVVVVVDSASDAKIANTHDKKGSISSLHPPVSRAQCLHSIHLITGCVAMRRRRRDDLPAIGTHLHALRVMAVHTRNPLLPTPHEDDDDDDEKCVRVLLPKITACSVSSISRRYDRTTEGVPTEDVPRLMLRKHSARTPFVRRSRSFRKRVQRRSTGTVPCLNDYAKRASASFLSVGRSHTPCLCVSECESETAQFDTPFGRSCICICIGRGHLLHIFKLIIFVGLSSERAARVGENVPMEKKTKKRNA